MYFTAQGTDTEPLCPLCGAAAGVVQYAYPNTKIIRCCGCGLWRTCPRLAPAELARYYEEHYYSESIRRQGQYEAWQKRHRVVWDANAALVRAEALKRGLSRPVVLDIGCGHGFFMQACQARGLAARGIETSPHAVKYAVEELKLDVRLLAPGQLPASELYDVITLWGVLEHVPQPLEAMRQVHAHLRPGGMVWVAAPNTNALERLWKGGQYFNFTNQSHLTHFHRRTLTALLQRAGFVRVRRHIYWGGTPKRGLSAAAQYLARRLCLGTELRFCGEKD